MGLWGRTNRQTLATPAETPILDDGPTAECATRRSESIQLDGLSHESGDTHEPTSYVDHMTSGAQGVQYQSPTWDPQFRGTPWAIIGPANIDAAGEFIYGKIRQNRELWPYFEKYNVGRIRRHVVLLLGQLLGGPKAFDADSLATAMQSAHADIKNGLTGEPITLRAFWLTSRIFKAAFLLIPEASDDIVETVYNTFWSLAPVIVKVPDGCGGWVAYDPSNPDQANVTTRA